MNYSVVTKLTKTKKRRILILSCGGPVGGIQSLYFSVTNDKWEILSSSFLPYPQRIVTAFDALQTSPSSPCGLSTLGLLDYRLSLFFTEAAKTTLSTIPTALRKPHAIVLNAPSLWRGNPDPELPLVSWEIPVGDAQHCATALQTPVFADILRNNCSEKTTGMLPTHHGDLRIAAAVGGTVVFVNIGLITRLTIVDTHHGTILVDSETGPGTCCIDAIVQRHHLSTSEHFDRDGSLAAQGQVNGNALNLLATMDTLSQLSDQKRSMPISFDHLIDHPELITLQPLDQLATITALTARSIYDFYRRSFTLTDTEQKVILSGGGSYNQTLLHYLQTYFDTIPVKSVETIGIPADMRIPLALGLTINAYFDGAEVLPSSLTTPPGRWVLP